MPYKYESFSVGLIYNNKEIIETYYKSRKPQSKEKLIAKVKKLQRSAIRLNEDYDMIISVLTDEGWRSDKIFTLHEHPRHISNIRNIPFTYITIDLVSIKYTFHIYNIRNIPST